MMVLHTCKEAEYCICSTLALEPNENCPLHGHPYPPRCATCGRFIHRKEQPHD